MRKYRQHVEAVGKLILEGIWFSDAIEITHTVLGPMPAVPDDAGNDPDQFQYDVDEYVDKSGKRVPRPQYKNIF